MLVDVLFYIKVGRERLIPFKVADFQSIFSRSLSAVTPNKKFN